MELRHLRYFVAIAEDENFHRAAERLHVSQSPLSRQMQDLEDEIGVELFEPAGRGVKLTAAGRLFAEQANGILASVAAAVEEVRKVAKGQIGTVSIGFETGTAYFGALAAIVAAFRRRVPRINLQLVPMSSAEQWEALRSGQIALGYGYYAPPGDASVEHLELARDRLGVVVSGEHRFAARSRLKVKDLADEPVLMQPRRLYPRLHDDIIHAARTHGVVLNVLAEVVDLEALLTLVACGDALTFLAEGQTSILVLGTAVWRPVVDLGVAVTDIVMWRADAAASPLVRPLIAIVHERAALQRGARSLRAGARAGTQRKR